VLRSLRKLGELGDMKGGREGITLPLGKIAGLMKGPGFHSGREKRGKANLTGRMERKASIFGIILLGNQAKGGGGTEHLTWGSRFL